MKRILWLLSFLIAAWVVASIAGRLRAAEPPTFQVQEYVTIHWSGRENTHVIRSNGKVEILGQLLTTIRRPDRIDERSFYMNIAMNAVAKEGYEFAGMTQGEIVMKRAVSR